MQTSRATAGKLLIYIIWRCFLYYKIQRPNLKISNIKKDVVNVKSIVPTPGESPDRWSCQMTEMQYPHNGLEFAYLSLLRA